MTHASQNDLVDRQFGERAGAYVSSTVHARGPDLERLAACVAEQADAHVLDLGCGGGHAAFAAAAHAARVTALDLSPAMLQAVAAEALRRGLDHLDTRCASVDALPFEAATFDLVCSRFSAHHWRDLGAGLGEARRVLRGDGVAVFMDIIAPGAALLDTHLQCLELLRDPSHVRDYRLAEWLQALDAAGFEVTAVARRRLRMDFADWTGRMRTPAAQVAAIRALQQTVPAEVARAFELEDDGSFCIDAATLEARPRRT